MGSDEGALRLAPEREHILLFYSSYTMPKQTVFFSFLFFFIKGQRHTFHKMKKS